MQNLHFHGPQYSLQKSYCNIINGTNKFRSQDIDHKEIFQITRIEINQGSCLYILFIFFFFEITSKLINNFTRKAAKRTMPI